jgi:hypothetical protein
MVPAGDQADAFIVPATVVNGQIGLFLVERHRQRRVTTRGYGTQDGSRAADLQLKNAPATLITTDGLTGAGTRRGHRHRRAPAPKPWA